MWQSFEKCCPVLIPHALEHDRDSRAIRDGNDWAVPWEIFPTGWYQPYESLTKGECHCCSLLLTPA